MAHFEISDQDERLSDFCHTASNPRRSLLIRILGRGERTVSDLVALTGFAPSNVSQHLKLLRDKRIVVAKRQGGYARYRLANTKILDALGAMRAAFLECVREDERMQRSGMGAPNHREPMAHGELPPPPQPPRQHAEGGPASPQGGAHHERS